MVVMLASPYEELKKRIILLELGPGQPLVPKLLASELGVSATPIREALIRLEGEGLVKRHPNSTAYVSEISFHDLKDVVEARLLLAGQIGRLAAARVTQQEISKMEQVLEKMKSVHDRRSLIQLDSEFHALVNAATKNPVLGKIASLLRNQVMRLWYFVSDEHSYWVDMISNHERFVQSLKDRDADAAARMSREHILRFIQEVRDSLGGEVC